MQNSDSFQFHREVPPHTGERTFSYHSHSLEDDAKTHAKNTKQRVSFIKKSNRAKYSHTGGLDAIVGVYILKKTKTKSPLIFHFFGFALLVTKKVTHKSTGSL